MTTDELPIWALESELREAGYDCSRSGAILPFPGLALEFCARTPDLTAICRVYGDCDCAPEIEATDVLLAVFDVVHGRAAHDHLFWLECFASRYPDGKVDATCRYNNEDWPDGRDALLVWANGWPNIEGCLISKRQFLLFEPTPVDQLSSTFPETRIQVTNETTLGASRRLIENGLKPLALNFANGVHPGGGFLGGARAQEEALCRSSALYHTLVGDPMYEEHGKRPRQDSTDWAIYSPDVPIFRTDDGTKLEHPWLLSFITCAAPYTPDIGQPEAGDLLQRRIHRVLAIARAYGYLALVLGAWGCGAFGNDVRRTAIDFRQALENEFSGAFPHIVFAIADWSPERSFLGPFRDVFA